MFESDFIQITAKYQSIKRNYLDKSAFEKWDLIRKIPNFTLKFVGIPILRREFKVYWFSLLPGLLGIDFLFLMAYTMWRYMDEPLKSLQSSCAAGIAVPNLILYANVLIPHRLQMYRSLLFFSGDYIYAKSKTSPSLNCVCDESAIELLTTTTSMVSLVFISISFITVTPVYAYFIHGEYLMPVAIILPFLRPDTAEGFYINIVHQLGFCFVGLCTTSAIEIMTCMLKNTVWAEAVVIRHSIDGFDKSLKANRNFTTDMNSHFRNIFIQIQDMDRYILALSDLYYWKFFLQPGLLVYSVTVSLFLYLYGNYMAGVGFAICCYVQIFILCDIGDSVNTSKELALDSLYNYSWYLMPPSCQKMHAHIINRLQNGANITIGPFAELNYETATNLTKMIYSYLMMMLEFITIN